MPSSKVYVDLRFGPFNQKVDRAVQEELASTGSHVAATSRQLASPRGGLERTIFRSPVVRTRRGWAVSIVAKSPGLYQEKGTMKKLGKKRSTRGRKAAAGHRGVKPLRFLLHGMKAHRGELVDGLRRRLS